MNQLTIHLTQHTSIVHFQAYETGATIRPAELKSKLMKFLTAKWDEKNVDTKDRLQSTDFKVRVCSKDRRITPLKEKSYGPFFGNTGSSEGELKHLVQGENGIVKIHFLSFMDIEKILNEGLLTEFFALHNFGTRSGKGFGSFTLQRYGDKSIGVNVSQYFDYDLIVNVNNEEDFFKNLNHFYNTLRSGINIGRFYFKSMLFRYARSKNIQWEKKTIKEEWYRTEMIDQQETHINEDENCPIHYPLSEEPNIKINKRFIRDLLGFAPSEDWNKYYSYNIHEKDISIEKNKGEENVQLINVERYQSPIFFKPVFLDQEYKVFIKIINTNDLQGGTINVKSKNYIDKPIVERILWEDFKVEEFLDFILLYIHVNEDFESELDNLWEVNKNLTEQIAYIYDSLKKIEKQ